VNMLVDSSVWVGHFKRRNEHMVSLLEADSVVCHPYPGAMDCRGLRPRRDEEKGSQRAMATTKGGSSRRDDRLGCRRPPTKNQVSLEILIDGNLDEKSLFLAAIETATLRATAL
jgi:hypothetical protein